jgi:hypothetical protein
MANAWLIALAALVCLAGCRTAGPRPVEIEAPSAERHFIVMGGEVGTGGPGEDARARAGAAGAGQDRVRRTN